MRFMPIVALLPLMLGGCLSYSEQPAPRTTVVLPPGTSTTSVVPAPVEIVCSNGLRPPC